MRKESKLFVPRPPIFTEYGDDQKYDIWDDPRLAVHDTKPWLRNR